MSGKHESGLAKFYRVVVPKMTSVGASIVIIGALFKIMHWPGAGMALTVGLLTEAFLFFMGAFQPAPPAEVHYEWERVYPKLFEETGDEHGDDAGDHGTKTAVLKTAQMDEWLKAANLTPETFKNFGAGMTQLNDNVNKMKDISNASLATDEYAKSAKAATQSLTKLSTTYNDIATSMTEMAKSSNGAAKDAEAYHKQVQATTKNLASLNAVYEMELKDADAHIKAMNKFYGNLSTAMANMSDASKESELFKQQMIKLTTNLTSLNTIYGNMLSAMKG